MTVELVTVVIPCYNQARFLGEAIESALRQTHPRREVVVVDDGSTDDPALVVARYPAVRLIRQTNRGLAGARNRGLGESRGEFLVFLDADDRLLPRALESGLRCLAAHPDAAFAYGHVRLIASDGAPLPTPHQVDVESDHYLALLRNNYIWTPGAVMYRRGVFDSVAGFNPRINASADFDLNVRIARDFPICCHGETTLEYRLHGANMTRDFAAMLKSAVSARRAHGKLLAGDKRHEQALREGIREVRRGYGDKLAKQVREFLRAGEWARAASGALTLLRYHPRGAAKVCLPEKIVSLIRRFRSPGAMPDLVKR